MSWKKTEAEWIGPYIKLPQGITIAGKLIDVEESSKYPGTFGALLETPEEIEFRVPLGSKGSHFLMKHHEDYYGRWITITHTENEKRVKQYEFGVWDGTDNAFAEDEDAVIALAATYELINV